MTRNGGCVARPSVSEGLVEGSDVEPKIGVGGDRDDTFRFDTADESGALDRVVDEFNAPVSRRVGHHDNARARRKPLDNRARFGFHAIEFAGVLIQKQKKRGSQKRSSISRPSRQTKRGKNQQTEDSSHERQARNEQTNPAGVDIGAKIFRQAECRNDGDKIEFQGKPKRS